MKRCQLDPKKPHQLTPDEIARRREADRQVKACNRIEGVSHRPSTPPAIWTILAAVHQDQRLSSRSRSLNTLRIGVVSSNRRKFRQAGFRPAKPSRAGTFRFSMAGGARSDDLEPARMPVAAF